MKTLVPLMSLVMSIALVGCMDDGPVVPVRTLDSDLQVEVVADGFDGPTQFLVHEDHLIVAELNGGERDGSGRVLSVSLDDPADRVVLLEGLIAPTGVAVADGRLWVMEQRRLTVGPLDDPADRRIVADELPFNGRSEGTITVVPGGGVLYDTSGRREGDRLADGSGSLWFVADASSDPEPYATGFKHAYAHVFDRDGQLWSTEIADGRLDDAVPPDELVGVAQGDDFGYPRCVGDRVPVRELGATDESCATSPASHALFDPGATPTSVAVAPWDPETLVVALWNRGVLAVVPRATASSPHRPVELGIDLDRPQHLVTDGDRLLLSDHGAGTIVAVMSD